MSILIKGMEMSKGRPVCIVIDAAGQARHYDLNKDRYADDKLFEAVPVPAHGRLIDADALDEAFTQSRWGDDGLRHWGDRKNWCMFGEEVETLLNSSPTIIEAEEGEA
jgi:hypothetical protein